MSFDSTRLPVVALSFVFALSGLAIAAVAVAVDNTPTLIAGMAVGALGPAVVRVAWPARPDQTGWPNTATTTERSKLFADQTPIAVLAQSDMIAK